MRKSRHLFRTSLVYAGLFLVLLIFVGPILWFVLLAIRPSETVFAVPPVVLFQPSPAAFQATFVDPGTNRHQLFNSLIVAGGAVLLNLPFSFPAAYAHDSDRPAEQLPAAESVALPNPIAGRGMRCRDVTQ